MQLPTACPLWMVDSFSCVLLNNSGLCLPYGAYHQHHECGFAKTILSTTHHEKRLIAQVEVAGFQQ